MTSCTYTYMYLTSPHGSKIVTLEVSTSVTTFSWVIVTVGSVLYKAHTSAIRPVKTSFLLPQG